MDLRPDRPDGVFLFVGPTGVGKTELARALCEALYGDEDRMIRLDMSEYVHSWALARLIGPQPGYVGYTEPESWLTTKIRRRGDTVLLLDEIEKAHPDVWNAFLQVFDAGRLSDARGEVTDFSRTVIAMTSNLGAGAFGSSPLGFGQPQSDLDRQQADAASVLDAVTKAMPPELVNRLDDIVVFRPLQPDAIREIAEQEIDRLISRLSARGYALEIGDDVITFVAESGYNPAYGARHLQRNLERLVLQPLTLAEGRDLVAELDGEAVVWRRAQP